MKRKYKTKRKYPCPYCDKKLYRDQLIVHVGEKHESMLPEGYSPARAVYDAINKKNYGTCMICKSKVYEWDPVVLRYKNICSNPACINAVRTKALNNHLNDPEVQMKMLAGRKISGTYEFTDGTKHSYVGSYEKKCLEFMDKVLQMQGKDILTPGPVVKYEYEGEEHTWILDILYVPAMLAIDCKDGGDNPNTREMKSYREKQKCKEDAIEKEGKYNYLRLTDNNFGQLLTALADIKFGVLESDPEKGIYINESTPGGAMIGMAAHQSVIVPRMMSGMNTDDVDEFTFGNTMLDKSIRFDKYGNIISIEDKDIDDLIKIEGKKILLSHKDNVLENINLKDGKAVLEAILGHPYTSFVDFLFCENSRLIDSIMPNQNIVNELIIEEYYNEYLNESSLKSTIDSNFKPNKKINLSSLKKVILTKEYINSKKKQYPRLKHLRYNEEHTASIGWEDKDGNLVALVSVSYPGGTRSSKDGDYNWISMIEILNQYKGSGLGKQVLNYAVKALKGNALAVYKDNEVAYQMYKKYGFKEDNEDHGDRYFMYLR